MLPADRLRDKLIVMNGKGVQVYQDLVGAYRFERFELHLDAVHADPAAPTCVARVRIDQAEAQVPSHLWESPTLRPAIEEFLGRSVREAIAKHVRARWAGRTPPLAIEAGGQEILARTCCTVAEDLVEIRLTIGLPADGRKVQAKPARVLLFEELPAVVEAGLLWARLDAGAAQRHADAHEDYLALRAALPALGLVAFLADGSLLAREAGPGDRPLRGGRAVALHAPEELAATITLPHRGPVRGLGIGRGVTVIAGAPYAGKSTLLAAIASGVYPHVPGDGRELVATLPDAVAVRAEPGRRIERVDVSGFVHALPHRPDVTALTAERAGAAVSMAAAVAEAVEIGTSLLLVDEDDGTVAFLVRDAAMRRLGADAVEPLTPLVDRVRLLWERFGISSIIVTGGLGDYLRVADTVMLMHGFQPAAATGRARALVGGGSPPPAEAVPAFHQPLPRVPLQRGLGGVKGRGLKAEMRGRDALTIGRDTVHLEALPQLADHGQGRAAGDVILHAIERGYLDGSASIGEILDRVFAEIEASGLAILRPHAGRAGDHAMPRRHEVAAILNRLRSLQVRPRRPAPEAADPEGSAPEGLAPGVPVPEGPAPEGPQPEAPAPAGPGDGEPPPGAGEENGAPPRT